MASGASTFAMHLCHRCIFVLPNHRSNHFTTATKYPNNYTQNGAWHWMQRDLVVRTSYASHVVTLWLNFRPQHIFLKTP